MIYYFPTAVMFSWQKDISELKSVRAAVYNNNAMFLSMIFQLARLSLGPDSQLRHFKKGAVSVQVPQDT